MIKYLEFKHPETGELLKIDYIYKKSKNIQPNISLNLHYNLEISCYQSFEEVVDMYSKTEGFKLIIDIAGKQKHYRANVFKDRNEFKEYSTNLYNTLAKEHNINYELEFINSKKILGQCNSAQGIISLNGALEIHSHEYIEGVIKHEIAHAIYFNKYKDIILDYARIDSEFMKTYNKSSGHTAEGGNIYSSIFEHAEKYDYYNGVGKVIDYLAE